MEKLTSEDIKHMVEMGEIEIKIGNIDGQLLVEYKLSKRVYNTFAVESMDGKGINILKIYEVVAIDANEVIQSENEYIRSLAVGLIEEVNKEIEAVHGLDFEMSDLVYSVIEHIENELI